VAGFASRRVALALFIGVIDDKRPLDQLMEHHASTRDWVSLSPQDRGFVRALATTALRRLGQIDDALRKLMDRPLPLKALKVKRILQLAVAQMLFLNVPDHAAVSIAVEQVDAEPLLRPWKSLANGVLRNLGRRKADILAIQDPTRFAVPRWLAERWTAAYGEETFKDFVGLLIEEPYLDISVKGDPKEWAEKLDATLLSTGSLRRPIAGAVDELPGFDEGAWWVQDTAASLPARLLGDVKGLKVADLCAAPGGKTAWLAAHGAKVTALDISPSRIERLKSNMARLKFPDVETIVADLAEWTPAEPFDAVLFDAPCSATGTIRRHPDVMRLKSKQDVADLASLQKALLARAHLWVKPGGTLVYCTCSLEPEEGEAQIAAFLKETPYFTRRPVAADEIDGLATAITAEGDMRTLPHLLKLATPTMSGMDGFFAARLVRTGKEG
jgi:16S rRNA (cytosine967-C5)-methyltransferase